MLIQRVPATSPSLTATGLASLVKAGKKGELYEQKFKVSPAIAQRILDMHNTNNRTINPTHLQSIMRDIKNERWIDGTGDNIRIDSDGSIVDGQHRLAAIINTGITLPLMFKVGVTPKAKLTSDVVRKKTYADYLGIKKGDSKTRRFERAAAIRLLHGFQFDQSRPHSFGNNNKPTNSELDIMADKFGDELAEFTSLGYTMGLGKVTILSYVGFLWTLFNQTEHADKAEEFFTKLATGANMDSDNPILIARNRLLTREEFRNQKNKDRTLGLIAKAWNLWTDGQTTSNKMHNPENMVPVNGLREFNGNSVYQPALAVSLT